MTVYTELDQCGGKRSLSALGPTPVIVRRDSDSEISVRMVGIRPSSNREPLECKSEWYRLCQLAWCMYGWWLREHLKRYIRTNI
jgi:hypothetical protein